MRTIPTSSNTATTIIINILIVSYLFHSALSFGTNCFLSIPISTTSRRRRIRSFSDRSSIPHISIISSSKSTGTTGLKSSALGIIISTRTIMMDEPFHSSTFSSLEWQPLLLSCIAGASTCIGAAVVFLQPRQGNKRIVPPGMMAFSLALAGSVMLTVSVVSIIPECLLQDDGSIVDDNAKGDVFQFIPFWSELMFYRVLFFVLGSILYFGLSRLLNIPEPQDLLLLHQGGFVGTSVNATTGGGDGGGGAAASSSHSGSHLGQMLMPNDADNGYYGRLYRKGKVDNDPEEDIATTTITTATANGQDQQIIEAAAQYYSFKTTSPHNNASPITSRLKKTKSREIIKTSSTENNNGKDKSRNKLSNWTKWTTGKDLQSTEQQKAWRVAILLFTSMLVHNFPEGLAVAASALESTNLGLTVTVGIMIHNIPEGIAIAIPCLAARPDQPWLGFVLASVSGLAEPMGAFVALMFLRGLERSSSSGQKDVVDGLMMRGDIVMSLENVLAFVAGIMVTVALWELFPEAMRHSKEDKKKSHFWYGTLAGMVVMVLTELYVQ